MAPTRRASFEAVVRQIAADTRHLAHMKRQSSQCADECRFRRWRPRRRGVARPASAKNFTGAQQYFARRLLMTKMPSHIVRLSHQSPSRIPFTSPPLLRGTFRQKCAFRLRARCRRFQRFIEYRSHNIAQKHAAEQLWARASFRSRRRCECRQARRVFIGMQRRNYGFRIIDVDKDIGVR